MNDEQIARLKTDAAAAVEATLAMLPLDVADRFSKCLIRNWTHQEEFNSSATVSGESLLNPTKEQLSARMEQELAWKQEEKLTNDYQFAIKSIQYIDKIASTGLMPYPYNLPHVTFKETYISGNDATLLLQYATEETSDIQPLKPLVDFIKAHQHDLEEYIKTQNLREMFVKAVTEIKCPCPPAGHRRPRIIDEALKPKHIRQAAAEYFDDMNLFPAFTLHINSHMNDKPPEAMLEADCITRFAAQHVGAISQPRIMLKMIMPWNR